MTEPSKKDPEIANMLEDIFGRSTAIKADVCVACGGPATEFRDKLSQKEYTISGLCQECQDAIFN